MENLYLAVMPAKAGIHWLQVLRDPRFRGDDGKQAFIDTLRRGEETTRRGAWPLIPDPCLQPSITVLTASVIFSSLGRNSASSLPEKGTGQKGAATRRIGASR